MTVVLPNGYVTLLEAAETLLPAMYAGVPDLPVVKSLRQKGIDVRDGPAMDQAVGELWKAVDEGGLRPMAIGGRPRRIERLDAAMTKQIPTLRHARGRGFTFLRQSNPAYHQPASCFGSDFPRATLAFRETEVHNLARKLIRTRRATTSSAEAELRVGSCYPMHRRHHSGSGHYPTATTKAPTHGYAESREAAMQAFAKGWHRE
jgi:hypothetical protein